MTAFLIFLVVLYLVAISGVTLPYWYERGNSPCEEIPSASYAPRPVAKLVFEAAVSILQLGLAYALDPIMRHIENADKHEDAADYPPVLLVHGLYHSPSGWMYLRKSLRKAGFRKIHTLAYSSWNTNIDAVTDHLESSVKKLEERYAGRKMLLVGHSLGGLVIRNWLAGEENQQRVLGVLTLGAPHRGSKMAALAIGALGRSLGPDNPFFAELARREKEASIPCVSLVSEADTMVLPQRNLVPVTTGWTMRVTPYATHAGMMTKGAVRRMTAWELHRMAANAPKAEPETGNESATAPEPAVAEKPAATTAPEPAPEQKPEPAPKPEPARLAEPKKDTGKTRAKAGKSAAKPDKKPSGK